MTIARNQIIDEGATGVYHCVARCVRRAFLCGWDAYVGKDYDHRKEWVRDRLVALTGSFAIDVLSYAVMSNHTHTVLQNRPDRVAGWSNEEVAWRWLKLFSKRRTPEEEPAQPSQIEIASLASDGPRVSELRKRLSSISWFMRMLNEHIARRANGEDACTGRFWEGRFKSQRLLDEAAVLTCMAYVDLNPIRAGIATSLEDYQLSGAYDRSASRLGRQCVGQIRSRLAAGETLTTPQQALFDEAEERSRRADWLARLAGDGSPLASMSEATYLELVDWTGRQIRSDKPGVIPQSLAPILDSLAINTARWVDTVDRYGGLFYRVAGRVESMMKAAAKIGFKHLRGIGSSRKVFSLPPRPA